MYAPGHILRLAQYRHNAVELIFMDQTDPQTRTNNTSHSRFNPHLLIEFVSHNIFPRITIKRCQLLHYWCTISIIGTFSQIEINNTVYLLITQQFESIRTFVVELDCSK